MSQTQDQVVSICESWLASGNCPSGWLKAGGKWIVREYAVALDSYINENYGGRYSADNLTTAAFAIQDQERQQQRQHKRAQTLAEQATAWSDQNPLFAKDDFNIAKLKDFFEANPTATIQDWDTHVARNHDSLHWLQQPQSQKHGTVAEKLAALGYGASGLQSHRDIRAQQEANEKRREAEKAKDPERIKKVKNECEGLVAGFSNGRNHASTARARAQLQAILDENKPNYFAAKAALDSWIKSYMDRSSVH